MSVEVEQIGEGRSINGIELMASAARTATTVGTALANVERFTSGTFTLKVTAAATEVDDTLDVFIQRLLADGVTWDSFARFHQVLGNGGGKVYAMDWSAGADNNVSLLADQEVSTLGSVVLSAEAVKDVPIGAQIRAVGIQVDAGGSADSFTYSVTANLRY